MYIPKQTILEESLRREIERICFADTLINRVVYDCVDQSLYTKVIFVILIHIGYRSFKSWDGHFTFLYTSII